MNGEDGHSFGAHDHEGHESGESDGGDLLRNHRGVNGKENHGCGVNGPGNHENGGGGGDGALESLETREDERT